MRLYVLSNSVVRLYVLQNSYECLYVLPNLYVRSPVLPDSSVCPYVRSQVVHYKKKLKRKEKRTLADEAIYYSNIYPDSCDLGTE